MKPFVKWAGGKTQLLKYLDNIKPEKFNHYFEPFLGGGAFLFNLKPSSATINDINRDLINAFRIIKKIPYKLISVLKIMVNNHNKFGELFYLNVRNHLPKNKLELAARFIYLNKTCFNGLYRENGDGMFNVPYNHRDEISIDTLISEKNIFEIHDFLKKNKINILCYDYKKVIRMAKKGDFVYVDPPYDKETDKTFTKYNKADFTRTDQVRLFSELYKAHKRGVRWVLSNHNTEFINTLYRNFNIHKVDVNRSINSYGSERKNKTKEVIICNY